MSIMPIPGMMSGFTTLASLIQRLSASRAADVEDLEDVEDVDDPEAPDEDEPGLQAMSREEFQSILQSLLMGITGETDAASPTTDRLAGALSPTLFSYFDHDRNGAIEGSEAENLQRILDLFHPDMIQAALERARGVETVAEQEEGTGDDEKTTPERVHRRRIQVASGLPEERDLFRAQATRMIRI